MTGMEERAARAPDEIHIGIRADPVRASGRFREIGRCFRRIIGISEKDRFFDRHLGFDLLLEQRWQHHGGGPGVLEAAEMVEMRVRWRG